MAGNDTHDDPSATEIEVVTPSQQAKGRRRKFIESSTQLKTAIYTGEEHDYAGEEELTIAERDPVPEHVSRVLEKAEALLASLGPEFDDKTASLRRPKRFPPSSTSSKEPLSPPPLERRPAGSVDFATRPQIDDAIGAPTVPILDTDEMIEVTDATRSLQAIRASTAAGSHRSQTVTELMKREAVICTVEQRPETATEVAPAFNVRANIKAGPSTLPSTLSPSTLSEQPIAPGPLADTNDNHSAAPNSDDLELDAMATLSTESPVSRNVGPSAFQPRAALESLPKRSALRSFLHSVKRLFVGR